MVWRIFGYTVLAIMLALAGFAALSLYTSRSLPADVVEARYGTPPSQFMQVEGTRIHYRDEGQGRPLVLIHGHASHLFVWQAWAEDLRRDYRVVRFDLPGHGLSGPDPGGDYSNGRTLDVVVAFIEQLDLDGAVVAGNSLGGLMAWRYALRRPMRTDGLILVAPVGFPASGAQHELPGDVPAAARMFEYWTPRWLVRQSLERLYGDPSKVTEDLVALNRDLLRKEGNRKALFARLRQFALTDPRRKLAQIQAPALILWGSEDAMLPASDGKRFAQLIRLAGLKVYDGLGHTPQEEAPERTLKEVRAFLEALGPQPSLPRRQGLALP